MQTRLRDIREDMNLTQIELAERSGVSLKTINQIENGHRKLIYIDTLRKLAKGLDVPVEALFAENRWEADYGKTTQGTARSYAQA